MLAFLRHLRPNETKLYNPIAVLPAVGGIAEAAGVAGAAASRPYEDNLPSFTVHDLLDFVGNSKYQILKALGYYRPKGKVPEEHIPILEQQLAARYSPGTEAAMAYPLDKLYKILGDYLYALTAEAPALDGTLASALGLNQTSETASAPTGGSGNLNKDNKEKKKRGLAPYTGYSLGNLLTNTLRFARDAATTMGIGAAADQGLPLLYELPEHYVTKEPFKHRSILERLGISPEEAPAPAKQSAEKTDSVSGKNVPVLLGEEKLKMKAWQNGRLNRR